MLPIFNLTNKQCKNYFCLTPQGSSPRDPCGAHGPPSALGTPLNPSLVGDIFSVAVSCVSGVSGGLSVFDNNGEQHTLHTDRHEDREKHRNILYFGH